MKKSRVLISNGEIFRSSKMATASHFVKKNVGCSSEMATNVITNFVFVKKNCIDLKWGEMCIDIDLTWPEMRSKVIFRNPKWSL